MGKWSHQEVISMNKILLFAGTTEGRNLAEFLEKNQIPTEVCVATQYGETLLEEGKYLHVHAGRLDETEMEQQIQKQKITLVIDATHPYAVIVSQNIRRACSRTGTEYIRLARKETDASWKQEMEDVIEVASVAEAAAFLAKKEGRIFAATGSKELSAYQVIPDYHGPGGGKSAFHPGGSIGVCHAGIFREESDLYAGTVYGRSECGDAQAGTGFMDGDKRIRKSRRFSGKVACGKKSRSKAGRHKTTGGAIRRN